MSSLGSPNPFFIAGKKAYEVERSLRFNSADDAYLTRTPSSTGNQKVWTWSAWFKRTILGTSGYLFVSNEANSSGDGIAGLYFQSDQLYTYYDTSGSNTYGAVNSRKYRDVSAWYHIVWQVDAANTTHRIWINGVEETGLSNNPIDYNYTMNQSGHTNVMGGTPWNTSNTSDLYLAEVHFSDGYKYAASDFAETDLLTGQWMPKKFDGSYGTNGFYLNFSDNSGTTATTLGKDYSGNGNNWTPNNFSVSAGAGNDSLEDTPTNNFPTLNPLNINPYSTSGYPSPTFTNGNLTFTTNTTSQVNYAESTMYFPKSGKWYIEATVNNLNIGSGVGYTQLTVGGNTGSNRYLWWVYSSPYYQINTNSGSQTIGSISNGDIIQIAYDSDTGNVWFGKNNSWYLSGDPANGTAMSPATTVANDFARFSVGGRSGSATNIVDVNFGQRAFSYTPPTGFKALNSANLPDPTILLPNKHFDTVLYTGNGSTGQSISTLQFQPDWIWFKSRTTSNNHAVYDSVRGRAKGSYPDANNAEFTDDAGRGLASFNANGFTVGEPQNASSTNINGASIVAWNWNGGDTDGKTYTVTVVSDSGNKYRFDGYGTSAVTLDLAEGGTYIFDWSDSSAQSHPIRFSTTSDGTHGGGSEYTTGVTKDDSAYKTTITIAASAPTLYYYCQNHSGMGGQVNTNSTLGSSNFDGTIQTTAKANATAGFSIVTWTGNGSSGSTLGHGLGVAPKAIITKRREYSSHWATFHNALGTGSEVYLDLTQAAFSSNFWVSSPTSSVFTVSAADYVNQNSNTYVAYCFSEVAGYSKFGSYTGNGSSDGTFVFLGFRPAWIMIKNTQTANRGWDIVTAKIITFNVVDKYLQANTSNAESTYTYCDFLSNGFKLRNSGGSLNANGDTFIYYAFAESPFKNARAR